jgi:hypothetical protein
MVAADRARLASHPGTPDQSPSAAGGSTPVTRTARA